ncbi:hypothetical protein ACVWXU_008608 [Streptomyces sp. TE33382]
MSLLYDAVRVESLTVLSRFRTDFYDCLTARADALFEPGSEADGRPCPAAPPPHSPLLGEPLKGIPGVLSVDPVRGRDGVGDPGTGAQGAAEMGGEGGGDVLEPGFTVEDVEDEGRERSEVAVLGLPDGGGHGGAYAGEARGLLEPAPEPGTATIHTLASCEWIKKSQPLCLIGDSGTGKSHMLIALGTEATMKGYRVRYTLATKLVNELVEAADEKQLNKTIARYGRVDLLCIDALGYMELDRHGAELLFQVLTEREEKNSVAIASNESFGGWTKTFTDPRLCAAIVDRLTFNGTIIETGTDSYRLATTRARAEQPAVAG